MVKVCFGRLPNGTIRVRNFHLLKPPSLDGARRFYPNPHSNLYISPPGVRCELHADGYDLFAVQLTGSKTWFFDGASPVMLQAGMSLFVPVGTRYLTLSGPKGSVHLSVRSGDI